ncbi:hypothetical protein BJX63DRAFT_373995 [Aspergillus granulosus]|uniref:RNase MRP protein 1 RNA binding domain-containing protein n=1 Tax=Aspergillus granulosus TaxID=176169 RepID=A0ABR4H1B6_9EURO
MEEDEILRVHSILHLISHRNKNQHSRTKWWKWLSVLKRSVWNLAQSLSSTGQANLLPAEFYRKYLADRVVPKCYLAFSVVVADVQFSPLGTVLLATLARLSKATGIDKDLKSRRRAGNVRKAEPVSHVEMVGGREDVGQALSRGEERILDVSAASKAQHIWPVVVESSLAASKEPRAVKEPDVPKQKKTKKKKKNAIDDLFDGLL